MRVSFYGNDFLSAGRTVYHLIFMSVITFKRLIAKWTHKYKTHFQHSKQLLIKTLPGLIYASFGRLQITFRQSHCIKHLVIAMTNQAALCGNQQYRCCVFIKALFSIRVETSFFLKPRNTRNTRKRGMKCHVREKSREAWLEPHAGRNARSCSPAPLGLTPTADDPTEPRRLQYG